jgi:CDGSH-type Zn-finger protein/ferredoxin
MEELASGQSGPEPEIRVSLDGPYVVTNLPEFRKWLGEELPLKPEMELCRCGQSSTKPFCDGSHATANFSGAKDPNRVPDKRDAYKGQQIEIFDNRGICAHSGFCTDHLASVFHAGKEPFVTPSGGRLDEIIKAVRACPSGALSYGMDGVEARNQVDQPRTASIEVSKDGPYRFPGGVRLVDEAGNEVPRAEGSSREHFSLCRCGHSQNKPFCSGMHWYVKFADPLPSPEHEPTLFEWAGGFPALLRMTRIFYSKYVPEEPPRRSAVCENVARPS